MNRWSELAGTGAATPTETWAALSLGEPIAIPQNLAVLCSLMRVPGWASDTAVLSAGVSSTLVDCPSVSGCIIAGSRGATKRRPHLLSVRPLSTATTERSSGTSEFGRLLSALDLTIATNG
jgi:hypothetical protein